MERKWPDMPIETCALECLLGCNAVIRRRPDMEGCSAHRVPATARRMTGELRTGFGVLPHCPNGHRWLYGGSNRKDMHMRSIASGLAAAGLLVASTASAAAAPAIPADARMSSPVSASEADGDSTWLWIAGGVVLLVALFLIIDDDNEDLPSSP